MLIGWVEHAGTHTARVKLLSDPACRMPVIVGRLIQEDVTALSTVDAEFWLAGTGDGRLRVIDVDHRYVESDPPAIQVGDMVLTSQYDQRLPVPLTIGTVSEIEANPHNRLLYTLTVESAVPERLREVYVLDLAGR